MTPLHLDPTTAAALTLVAGLLMARLGLSRKMLSWRLEPRHLPLLRRRHLRRFRRPGS